MKKIGVVLLFCLSAAFCSFFSSKTSPYPEGIIFPLVKDEEIPYKGEIINSIEGDNANFYFSTNRNFVYCMDGMERDILWEFEAPELLASPPYLGSANIYVYDENQTLYCLDRKGKLVWLHSKPILIWKKDVKERITSGVLEFQDRVFFGTEKGSFFALSADNGEERWDFRTGGAIRSTPVLAGDNIIFGCDDHNLYFLSLNGELQDKIEVGEKIQSIPLVERKRLYFGADDHYFYCFDLKSRKRKWRVKTGGKIFTAPITDKNRIFFLCWNNVLYCLDKNAGTIIWWKSIPSRSYYHLEISGDKILAASLSSLLIAFDTETGERIGSYDAGQEIRSNPIWFDPYILINLYDRSEEEGKLLFLKKEVKVDLKPSKKSPYKLDGEIVFTASTVGFFHPEYEFYLVRRGKKTVVQEKSEVNSWGWFPENMGKYFIGVEVTDEKENEEVEIPFLVEKEYPRLNLWNKHLDLKKKSPFNTLTWRSVGPQIMGGRITDIAVPKDNPYVIYAAAASGGVWKTVNNGTTWKPIFDNESCLTVGDIAISDSDPDIIWVGGGENNSSRSSYSGTGVFKSINGGTKWQNMGLGDTHHIGRIVIHPEDPDIVYVAAIGHLYTQNKERGLFRTDDGGKSWDKVLYINDDTGVIDVVMDPSDPETLYAAAWQRSRKAWNFTESGPGSGIYKTADGGLTWKQLTSGFPAGEFVGRIGLSIAQSKPNVIYALLDNQAPRPEEKPAQKTEADSGISLKDLEKMSREEFLKLEAKRIQTFLKENNAPPEIKAAMVIEMVRNRELTPQMIAHTLMDANRSLFETNIIGPEVYRSADKGETWQKVNERYIERFYNTYGYYFGQIRVDPTDESKVYILGVPLMVSEDGAKTFESIDGSGVHADHHALWIDPDNPVRLIDGNDGGLNFSYDGGKTWQKVNNIPLGQFYTVTYDMEVPYNIYGGLQDNGVYYGPHTWRADESEPWKMILGGDGAYVQVDPLETDTVYTEFQFGNVYRINKRKNLQKSIKPKTRFGEPPLRFNWQTPILISPHNRFIIYLGANKLFKSLDGGDLWYPISHDLTTNPKQGDVPYGCIITISESPIEPGLIYVGTDDGNVWLTKNGGVTWEKINQDLPSNKWVSRLEASRFEEGTVYVSLNGYRDDDFDKYLYKSLDYGKTWVSIASNIPCGPINVVREDPKKKNILYVGTDLGVYVSIDSGKSWSTLGSGLPTIYVHDLVIHPRDNDIIIGTHGRSVYILDAEPIQGFDKKIQEEAAYLFDIMPVFLSHTVQDVLRVRIYFYLKKKERVFLSITDNKGKVVRDTGINGIAGFNLFRWNLIAEGSQSQIVDPGEYKVELTVGKLKLRGKLLIKSPFK
ncbi:MAG: PQQ-binding-like beta-propeller repeat protein [Candidatus Aminicenantes bacterium]|nr:MAG: PQQ-binding-like beta-propeller repeat protein [Candidatus Aminicenantes bacterium]